MKTTMSRTAALVGGGRLAQRPALVAGTDQVIDVGIGGALQFGSPRQSFPLRYPIQQVEILLD